MLRQCVTLLVMDGLNAPLNPRTSEVGASHCHHVAGLKYIATQAAFVMKLPSCTSCAAPVIVLFVFFTDTQNSHTCMVHNL